MKLRRPTTGIVLAAAALVLAMGGSAGAAALITSKQIKDGTIQIRDLNAKVLARSYSRVQSDSRYFTKAQSDARYRAPLGTRVALAGYAFHPLDATSALAERYVDIGAVNPAAGTDPSFFAALPVPQGARITGITLHALDDDGTNDIHVQVGGVFDNASGDGNINVSAASNGSDPSYRSFTGTLPVPGLVDLTQTAPWVKLTFDGTGANTNLVVASVRVTYTLP